MPTSGWIGVDLDGTLAHYAGWKGDEHIGAPVPAMVARVKQWLAEGMTVKIFTARVGYTGKVAVIGNDDGAGFSSRQVKVIEAWCERHIGKKLEVTATKDFGMVELWDDRAIQVEMNTGRVIGK
jgi:hypothetical protein